MLADKKVNVFEDDWFRRTKEKDIDLHFVQKFDAESLKEDTLQGILNNVVEETLESEDGDPFKDKPLNLNPKNIEHYSNIMKMRASESQLL